MEAPRKFYSSMLLRSNTLSVLERYSRRLNGNVDSIGYGVTLIDKLRYEEYHMTILHDPTFIQGHRKEMLTGTAGSQRTDLMAGIIRTRVTTIHVADNIIMRVEIVIPLHTIVQLSTCQTIFQHPSAYAERTGASSLHRNTSDQFVSSNFHTDRNTGTGIHRERFVLMLDTLLL